MRRALVVAHPDDESLFFGGLLVACPGNWTILCASTPRADPVRARKFFDAARALGAADARICSSTEPPAGEPMDDIEGRLGDLGQFDEIVTHNAVGEYGHVQHISINRYIAARWPERIVTGGYGKAGEPHRIVLTPERFGRKLDALRCYDHVSPNDGRPKWEALLDRYGRQFELSVETYSRPLM
jgi:LmbE family N-acetylglucosaminyl deacetylase